ncbi:hypothetical protein Tco_0632206, partial [Tanacetum coccineum]
TVVVCNDIPNIAPDVVIDGIAVLIPTILLIPTLVAYLGVEKSGTPSTPSFASLPRPPT